MRYLYLLTCFMLFSCVEAEEIKAKTENEVLFARRILKMWQDEEYSIVEQQIKVFFAYYPDSSFKESFKVLLGDNAFRQADYRGALKIYKAIENQELQNKVQPNIFAALFHLQEYSKLTTALKPFMDHSSVDLSAELMVNYTYYMAESFLRLAAQEKDLETSKLFCLQAKPYFQSLMNSAYQGEAHIALAEIYRIEGSYKDAAVYYLALSKQQDSQREKMLFEAAQMQRQYDKRKAAETFADVFQIQGALASEAAIIWLDLMYDLQEFEIILESREKLKEWVTEDMKASMDFILATSAFRLEQFEEAKNLFQSYFERLNKTTLQYKEALLMFSASAFYLKDFSLVNKAVIIFEELFPEDRKVGKMLFFRAALGRERSMNSQAKKDFLRLSNHYAEFKPMDVVKFELAVMLYEEANWSESYEAFQAFLSEYPGSYYIASVRKYLLHASVHVVDSLGGESKEEGDLSRWRLVMDLREAMEKSDYSEKEFQSFRIKLAKTLFDLQSYHDTVKILKRYFEDTTEESKSVQAHILLALSYRELDELEKFIFHAEHVIDLNKDFLDEGRLRLGLFSAYLLLAKKNKEEATRYHDQAARELYIVITEMKDAVSQGNHLWLANYYYKKVAAYMEGHWQRQLENSGLMGEAEKSRRIFSESLKGSLETIHAKNLTLESEFFKYTLVLSWMNQTEEQLKVLQALEETQSRLPDLDWKLKGRTLLALASLFEQLGHRKKAIKCYSKIEEVNIQDSAIRAKASLYLARLSLAEITDFQKEASKLEKILQKFKHLQIKKKLAQEPVHLEAALDYANARVVQGDSNKRDAILLYHLNNVKEEFAFRDDISSRDYKANRELMPEKEVIYQAYLMLVDAQIAILESRIARKLGKEHEGVSKKQAAEALFRTLQEGKFTVSHYLLERVNQGLKDIEEGAYESAE